jgi:hypothetical protein
MGGAFRKPETRRDRGQALALRELRKEFDDRSRQPLDHLAAPGRTAP